MPPHDTMPLNLPVSCPHFCGCLSRLQPASITSCLAATLAWATLPSLSPDFPQADSGQKPPPSGMDSTPEGPVSHTELHLYLAPNPVTLQCPVSRPLQAWSQDGH